jgi:cell wall-associated NlpC family hydrolase
MFLPLRRRDGLAGSISARRMLAFACAAALLLTQADAALAADPAAPTVHIRGGVPSTDNGALEDSAALSGEGQALFEVSGREVNYPQPEPVAPPPTAGEAIVGFALGYVGFPYVYAGNTPAGFDCSGFTQWVVLNTLGIDIGHGLTGQPGAGYWIDYGAWLPGDLVFFQNTYQAGISHVGIYIGDGLFVHAENEGTGVVISSMYSAYYGSRYWGSVRVA